MFGHKNGTDLEMNVGSLIYDPDMQIVSEYSIIKRATKPLNNANPCSAQIKFCMQLPNQHAQLFAAHKPFFLFGI